MNILMKILPFICCQLLSLWAYAQEAPPATAEPQSITLPAGTEIAIRTIDRIDSKTADLSRDYAAILDDPIVVDDVTVAPANANAFLRVTDKKSAGFKRRAYVSLSLIAVVINGQRVAVVTDTVDSQSGSQAKRTLAGTAVGAGTGAVIGGIAGGGVGAGIGAGVGAVGGAIAGKLMGKSVQIAPETRFSYRLSEAVTVPAVR
jgi:uncharacterized protein YcfJ